MTSANSKVQLHYGEQRLAALCNEKQGQQSLDECRKEIVCRYDSRSLTDQEPQAVLDSAASRLHIMQSLHPETQLYAAFWDWSGLERPLGSKYKLAGHGCCSICV